jgi:hypothetical protein
VKEGEKAEMSAQVKDIDDGNMVTFQVWRQGQDPAAHVPLAQVMANVEGGEVRGEWLWWHSRNEPLKEKPKFFFTAHSAWCPPKQSGNVEIEGELVVKVLNTDLEGYKNLSYTVTAPDGSEEEGTLGDDGTIELKQKIPGKYKISFRKESHHG